MSFTLKFIDIAQHLAIFDGLIDSFKDLGPDDMPCLPSRMHDFVIDRKIDVLSMIQSVALSPNKSMFIALFNTPFQTGEGMDTSPIAQPLIDISIPQNSLPQQDVPQERLVDAMRIKFLALVGIFIYSSSFEELSTKRAVPLFSVKHSFSSLSKEFNTVHSNEANTYRVIVYNPAIIPPPRKKNETNPPSTTKKRKTLQSVEPRANPMRDRNQNKTPRLEEEQYKERVEREKETRRQKDIKSKERRKNNVQSYEETSDEEYGEEKDTRGAKGNEKKKKITVPPPLLPLQPLPPAMSVEILREIKEMKDTLAEEKRLRVEKENEIKVLTVKMDHKDKLAEALVAQRGSLALEWKGWANHGAELRGQGIQDFASIMRANKAEKKRKYVEPSIACATAVVEHSSSSSSSHGAGGVPHYIASQTLQPTSASSNFPLTLPPAPTVPAPPVVESNPMMIWMKMQAINKEKSKRDEEEKKRLQDEADQKKKDEKNQKNSQLMQMLMFAQENDVDLDMSQMMSFLQKWFILVY